MLVMRNKFGKIKEFASEAKPRSGRPYYLIGTFDQLNANAKWPYWIFKPEKSSLTKIEDIRLRRIGLV